MNAKDDGHWQDGFRPESYGKGSGETPKPSHTATFIETMKSMKNYIMHVSEVTNGKGDNDHSDYELLEIAEDAISEAEKCVNSHDALVEGLGRAKRTITYLLSCAPLSDITDQEKQDQEFIQSALKQAGEAV